MRRFLKRLRKGIRTACLTAVLATCWQVGQPAQALATIVPVRFSGTVSPAENDVSHLFLIYGTGYSSIGNIWAVKLGDFLVGQTNPFSVTVTTHDAQSLFWFVAGLYGDISSGQYTEGTNGVTAGVYATEGDLWDEHISINEATFFTDLLNDDSGKLASYATWRHPWHVDYLAGLEITASSPLFDFSQASNNGQISFESQIVPEPVTIVLLGTGGLFVLYRRRKE